MIDQLLQIDNYIFFLINNSQNHSGLLDLLALLLSGVGSFGLIWLVIGFVVFIREEHKDHRFIYLLFTAACSAYVLAEILLKPLFGRLRPEILNGAYLVQGGDASSYSFPSGHATIAFTLAVVLGFKEPKIRFLLYILASLISLSRVYLGKHFPSDIIAGAILGYLIGRLMINFYGKTKTLQPKNRRNH